MRARLAESTSDRVETGSVLLSTRAGRLLLASVVCLAIGALAVHSLVYDARSWPYQSIARTDGTLLGAISGQSAIRLVTFYIGMASRDAAGGRITELIGPSDLHMLAEYPDAEGTIGPYSSYYLQQMSGWGYVQGSYDPVLSAERIRRIRAEYEAVEYPRNVVAIVDGHGDGSVVLFTDEEHEHIYCLPGAVAEKEASL